MTMLSHYRRCCNLIAHFAPHELNSLSALARVRLSAAYGPRRNRQSAQSGTMVNSFFADTIGDAQSGQQTGTMRTDAVHAASIAA
jgi:hypothetical protein